MKFEFKNLVDSLLEESDTDEEKGFKLDKMLAKIRKEFGDDIGGAGAEALQKLFDLSDEFSKNLKILSNDINSVPAMKSRPHTATYKKGVKTIDEIRARHGLTGTLYDHDKVVSELMEKKKQLYRQKIADMSEVISQKTDAKVPIGQCQLEYVIGNSKVGDDTIIINMGPATVCDAAREGQCELYEMGFCYAQNNETQYKGAFAKRFKQLLQWKHIPAEVLAAQIALVVVCLRSGRTETGRGGGKKAPIQYVRFNESGDFNDKSDVKKLKDVVRLTNEYLPNVEYKGPVEVDPAHKRLPVIFYTYTHRSDLFRGHVGEGESVVDDTGEYLIIQGSGLYKDEDKRDTKKPFMVDNCFMGIDYDNLLNLVQNQDTEEVTEKLGIDFNQALDNNGVVICRGECKNCLYCKTKGKKIILVCYHGMGTRQQSILQGLRKRVKDALEASNDIAVNQLGSNLGLPQDIVVDLINVSHYNENALVEKLIELGSYKKMKTEKDEPERWKAPLIDLTGVMEFLEAFRKYADEAFKNITLGDVKIHRPRTAYLRDDGKKAEDHEIKSVIDRAILKNKEIENKLIANNIIPESYTWFEYSYENVLNEGKDPNYMDISSKGTRYLANLAVANKLSSHKQFVHPEDVQYMFDENGYETNVLGDELPIEDEDTIDVQGVSDEELDVD